MSSWVTEFGGGYGISWTSGGTGYTYRVNGKAFNPNSADQSIPQSAWASWDYGSGSLYNATTSYDLTGFQTGNEVFLGYIEWHSTGGTHSSGTIRVKNPVGTIIWTWNYDGTDPNDGSEWEFSTFLYIGIRDTNSQEIERNGTYTFEATGTFTNSQNFDITNLDTSPVTTPCLPAGDLWVQEDYLWFTNAHQRKMYVRHDGTNYGSVGTSESGHIWIVSGEHKISYVDSSGIKRKTKNGARYRNWNDDATHLGNAGSGNSGYIWDCNYDDHFLLIVDSSGQIWRIGAGCCGSISGTDAQ